MDDKDPFLLIKSPECPEKRFTLGDRPVYIGRLPENDVCIRDRASSRRHCKIEPDVHGFRLLDLASSNGTLVNGVLSGEKYLQSGDKIQIGKVEIHFVNPGQPVLFKKPPGDHEQLNPKLLQLENSEVRQAADQSQYFNKPQAKEAHGYYLLYQIGRLLCSSSQLEPLLQSSLEQLFEHFSPQRGFIALMDPKTNGLTPCVHKIDDPVLEMAGPNLPSNSISSRAIHEKKAILTFDATSDPRFSSEHSITESTIRSVMCAPLFHKSKVLGAIYLDHLLEPRQFSETDLDLLNAVANLLAAAVYQHAMRQELDRKALFQANLERFHSPDVVSEISKKIQSQGELQREVIRTEATILFSDIKGFTTMSERLTPEEIALLLNNYLNKMTQIIFKYRGTVNKFIGDAVMAIFGVPIRYDSKDAARAAIRAAIDMQAAMKEFLRQIAPHKHFQIRIGINTGEVVAGYIGADKHLEYTVLGDAVNIASRLESQCSPGGILIGERTHQLTEKSFDFVHQGETLLKGKSKAIDTYQVQLPPAQTSYTALPF